MTTIAYRDGILAADSRIARGSMVSQGEAMKLYRMPDGSVAAGAGTVGEIIRFINWLAGGKLGQAPALGDTGVVHLQADGLVVEYHDETPVPMVGEFEAWGSGAKPALAALHCGLSAEQAVKIACKIDSGSAEPVFTARVEIPSKPEGRAPRRGAAASRGVRKVRVAQREGKRK